MSDVDLLGIKRRYSISHKDLLETRLEKVEICRNTWKSNSMLLARGETAGVVFIETLDFFIVMPMTRIVQLKTCIDSLGLVIIDHLNLRQ